MLIARLLICCLTLTGCAGLVPRAAQDATPTADPFERDPFFLDNLLEWPGSRHGTLGPTGGRLFADELLPAPGFRGRFGDIHQHEDLFDLVRYEFTGAGGPLEPSGLVETWRPSYHETSFRLGAVTVRERKFITDEDLAVSLLTLLNQSAREQRLGVFVTSDAAGTAAFRPGNLVPLNLSIHANRPPCARFTALAGDAVVQVEGIPFQLIDPAGNSGRSLLGLKGGQKGDALFELPERIEIPLNARVARLHLLGQIGDAPERLPEGTVVARYRVFYEEGAPPTYVLRYGQNAASFEHRGGLPAARGEDGLFLLTIPLNPERLVRFISFEKGRGEFAPVLAAVTAELGAARSPAYALSGAALRFGVPRAHVLAGDVRDGTIGDARLRVREWNRPRQRLEGVVDIQPGATAEIRVVHAVATEIDDALARTAALLASADPLLDHRQRWHGWFARNCPRFESGDPLLDKLWWYRWFVVRHNLARPAAGNLQRPVFYEGKHGDWYPKLVSYASPHIIAETRWLADPEYARNQIRAHLATADADGLLRSARVDWAGAFYTHWIARAALGVHEVHPDLPFLAEVADALAADVDATLWRYDPDGDGLPAAPGLYASGMEFQPSAFYFAGYDNSGEPATLERPDFAAYLYGNARAVQVMFEQLARPDDAARMAEVAARVRTAALETLWNDVDATFYAVAEEDDRPAFCQEIVAFYPWLTGLPPDEFRYARSLNQLFDPERFRTAVPFSSCSRRVPAFSAALECWPGPGGKTEHCMWNGPVWPHADSVIATALGEVLSSRQNHDLRPEDLREFLRAYALLHFENGDLDRPLLRETADADTGRMWGCPDYFHSTWIDLVCRYHALLGWPAPWLPGGRLKLRADNDLQPVGM